MPGWRPRAALWSGVRRSRPNQGRQLRVELGDLAVQKRDTPGEATQRELWRRWPGPVDDRGRGAAVGKGRPCPSVSACHKLLAQLAGRGEDQIVELPPSPPSAISRRSRERRRSWRIDSTIPVVCFGIPVSRRQGRDGPPAQRRSHRSSRAALQV